MVLIILCRRLTTPLPHLFFSFFFFFFLLEMDTDVVQESEVQISGCYKIASGIPAFHLTRIEHSCLMTPENKWEIQVKCRPLLHDTQEEPKQSNKWRSLTLVYPDAKVQLIHNDIEVTLPSLREDVEIAAFGRPGKEDKKRMQMAIFAKRPKQGRDWQIWVYLVDDTNPACKVFLLFQFVYLSFVYQ